MSMLIALWLTAAPPPLSLDEVLARNYAARGGLERLRALKAVRIRSHNEGGFARFDVVATWARGLKWRREVSAQGMTEVRAVDGTGGWYTNAFGGRKDAVAMSVDELSQALDEADLEGPLVDWRRKGHRVELVGVVDVDGSPAYRLKVTLKSGTVELVDLDADAFIEVRVITQRKVRGALVETEAEYGNYEPVDGLYFPFSVERRARRSSDTDRVAVDGVEIDPPVLDATFARPEARP
jgi:hypothetical protein